MSEHFRKYEIEKAMARWRWSYRIGYLWAILTIVNAFVFRDNAGNLVAGVLLPHTIILVALGILIGGLAWGLHKFLRVACIVILFILALLEAVVICLGDEPSTDMLYSWVFVIFLFRGLLSAGALTRFRDVMRQELSSGSQRTDTPQPDAAQHD